MEKHARYTTEVLAEFVLGLRAEDIPPATVETVQRCVLDLVGAAAAAAFLQGFSLAGGDWPASIPEATWSFTDRSSLMM